MYLLYILQYKSYNYILFMSELLLPSLNTTFSFEHHCFSILGPNRHQSQLLSEKCLNEQEWGISSLIVVGDPNKKVKHINILKQIREIGFPHLVFLSLPKNQIESIESINQLQAPFLNNLDVGYNRIAKVKCLRKADWKEMQSVSIEQNGIRDWQSMCEMKLGKIEGMVFEACGKWVYDWRWMVKLERGLDKQMSEKVVTKMQAMHQSELVERVAKENRINFCR